MRGRNSEVIAFRVPDDVYLESKRMADYKRITVNEYAKLRYIALMRKKKRQNIHSVRSGGINR